MSAIQVGGQLQPGTVDTPLDARVRIESLDAVSSIPVPFVGMIFYAKKEAKLYVVKSLKQKQLDHTLVDDAEVKEYEEIGAAVDLSGLDEKFAAKDHTHTADQVEGLDEKFVPLTEGKIPEAYLPAGIAGSGAKPATITLPVPYDRNNDNVTLVIDFDEDGTFTGNKYTRVTMKEHYEKMKVFSNDKYIACEGDSVGVPFYGQSVSFTLDKNLFSSYEPGKTYFARYCWEDSNGGRTEWKGFQFTGDVAEMEPIRLPEAGNALKVFRTAATNLDVSDGNGYKFSASYSDGEIQFWDLTAVNYTVHIDSENIQNIPYGEVMLLYLTLHDSYDLYIENRKIPRDSTVNTVLVTVMNFGLLSFSVSEVIPQALVL